MSSRKEQGTRVEKKSYTKPEVKQVPLRPEEAVLGNCKVAGTGGPDGANCYKAIPPNRCSSLGS